MYPKIAFFGTPDIAVHVLDILEQAGIVPSLIITNPDAPQGRKLVLTPSKVAAWAHARNVATLKPQTLKDQGVIDTLTKSACDLFIVAAYGKIIPETILNIPKYKTLNIHPSLLPKLRGASPIRSAILTDMNPTGVSIMELNAKMDEGPILAQKELTIPKESWPMRGSELDKLLVEEGATLLVSILPKWINGEIVPQEQKHEEATYCTKITKEMGLLDLSADPYQNLLKIRAFDGWPGTYFFHEKEGTSTRIKIIDATIESSELKITRVIPEGKNEMDYDIFLQNQ